MSNKKQAKKPAPPKLNLNDLQRKRMDWSESDNLINVECPSLLSIPVKLNSILSETNVLEKEELNKNYILGILSRIKDDVENLIPLYNDIKQEYDEGKTEFRYEEDAFMFMLNISSKASAWVETYRDTVLQTVFDVIEYINSKITEPDEKINL